MTQTKRGRRALVTGGAGFIGSHLCEALIARGVQVHVLDDLSTGREANIPDGVVLHRGCVLDERAVAAALDGAGICFHLAAIASVERCRRDWLQTHRVNVAGLVTVFDAIARSGAPVPVVYASSAAIYGDNPSLPIAETAPASPLSAYGADKHACELHAAVATRVHAIPTTGLRFFNVYGPRQDPSSPYSGVISVFADRIARGAPIEIHGDGGQVRDFVHVDDVVAALLAAARSGLPGAPVLNVCTGTACSILELARELGRVCGQRPQLRFAPARAGDIRRSVGDPTLGRTALGLPSPTRLAEGLRRLLLADDAGATVKTPLPFAVTQAMRTGWQAKAL